MAYEKPLPVLTEENRPFWEALKHGELRLQRCLGCGEFRYPIGGVCPRCLDGRFEWARVGGRGTVFSFVVFHQVYHPAFTNDVPYNVALVQLDEGPRLFSNIVGIPNDEIKVDARVELVFHPVTAEITLPRFRPING